MFQNSTVIKKTSRKPYFPLNSGVLRQRFPQLLCQHGTTTSVHRKTNQRNTVKCMLGVQRLVRTAEQLWQIFFFFFTLLTQVWLEKAKGWKHTCSTITILQDGGWSGWGGLWLCFMRHPILVFRSGGPEGSRALLPPHFAPTSVQGCRVIQTTWLPEAPR